MSLHSQFLNSVVVGKVSIPFKREGTCELHDVNNPENFTEFQFPSNGKARVNFIPSLHSPPLQVSIPFKREGTGEPGLRSRKGTKRLLVSIPFKREGTGEPVKPFYYPTPTFLFQFPSNGKARVNEIRAQLRQIWAKSFNSLQTGRHV